MTQKKRLSMTPFVITALHSWIEANDETPFIVVDLTIPGVEVPAHLRKDPTLTLNIGSTATRHLSIVQEGVFFNARFNGADFRVKLPTRSVMMIFSKESHQGMTVPHDPVEESHAIDSMTQSGAEIKPAGSSADFKPDPDKRGDVDAPAKGRGHLRVIK